jgi:hypothetical protein
LARFRRVRLHPLVFGEAFFETLCCSRCSYGAGGRCYRNSRVAFFVALSLPMSQLGSTLSMVRLIGIFLLAMRPARLNLIQALKTV